MQIMKYNLLCLFVVIASTARSYRYAHEEYLPTRRYLRGASSVYSRSPPRAIRGLEEESYNVPEPRSSLVQQQPDEILEKRFSQARTGKSLPKEEEVKPFAVVEKVPAEGFYEEQVKLTVPPIDEELQENNGEYQNKPYFDEVEEDGYEEELEGLHDEGEAEETEDYHDDFHFEENYGDNDHGYDEYEEDKDENEEESGEVPAKEEEQHTMSLELADVVFSFPKCYSITCSKAGLEGYGCSESKCKFICTKSECYEYPDGPTDLEGLEVVNEAYEEEVTTTTEEITTTTEATTTTTAITPEPETTTQVARKRRPSFEKRGKGRRARSRQ